MPTPIAPPAPAGPAPAALQRTVLLTGASGIVGAGLPQQLRSAGMNVICLVHKKPVPGVTSRTGDITREMLGLPVRDYEKLAADVTAVVHCAANTNFRAARLERANVAGTGHIAAFAAEAGATLYHVSTAFINTTADGRYGRTAARYAASKREAEQVVKSSGAKHVILRPSIVVGDSATGKIAAFQGFYDVVNGIIAGRVPVIPFASDWPLDCVPVDFVTGAITAVVKAQIGAGEFWVTAGRQALRLDEVLGIIMDVAAELGIRLRKPRFVPPGVFDRPAGRVLLRVLPERAREHVLRSLDLYAVYLGSGAKPSSIAELRNLGAGPLPDPRETLRASLGYWAAQNGYGHRGTGGAGPGAREPLAVAGP